MMIGRDSIISFGKYKGKTGAYIAQTNPGYIFWLENNINRVSIDPSLRRLAVSVGMIRSEETAEQYGSASDWGFSDF